eukprot:CAMPEP_0185264082 /NCGR_PEP_ID=MMETSP1359-20130426/18707_1 /TAXON_ID=552665 /ORGANISM="Bigelowiella longifila, Strain CCMP242" /LENGTH=371 /DNA_ID=CAMNT_0027852175 /DNA_START=1 /DNA_END=1116 /DNA_ORIENTATION=+
MGYGGADMTRPSFFEVAAADRLTQGLRPALQHILSTMASHFPQLSFVAQRGDELFYTMCYLLDRRYLKTHGASFAENFYCLKRVKILPDGTETSLGARDQLLAVLCVAGVPYLRTRLEGYYLEMRQDLRDMQALGVSDDGSLISFFKRAYVAVYPYMALAYEGLEYLHAVRYVMGATLHFSPLTHLINQRVVRVTMKDIIQKRLEEKKRGALLVAGRAIMPSSSMESAWEAGSRDDTTSSRWVWILKRIVAMISRIGGLVADNAKWAVYIGVFLIRFLQWWYSPENEHRRSRPTAAPPPPPRALPHPKGLKLPSDAMKCPLCQRTRVNAALLPSGFVFCYACIFKHLKNHGTCPVTLRPCRMEDLRKIYEN